MSIIINPVDGVECVFPAPETYSETSKYRHLTAKHCWGVGVDIGSQGRPVVPWAWQIELSAGDYVLYNGDSPLAGPVQSRSKGENLSWIDSGSLDFVYSSHLLEDFQDWTPVLSEWTRVLKPGGKLVILLPDKELWELAMKRGQMGNPAHRHEGMVGEISGYAEVLGIEVLEDRRTECFEGDYTLLFVGRKK